MPSITAVIIGNNNHEFSRFAIEKTLKAVECQEVITFSDRIINDDYTFIPLCNGFNRDDFSYFCLKNLWAHVRTDFVLILHYDGMAVNKEYWSDEYFDYDYIGAPWPESYTWVRPEERVGNGGFTLRSMKLLNALRDPGIFSIMGNDRTENEDAVICQSGRQLLVEKYGIKFAPIELADQFSHECNNFTGKTLGFHGLWNMPLYCSEEETLFYVNGIPGRYWSPDRRQMFFDNCRLVDFQDAPRQLVKQIYKR